jgi:hypothetical protein
VAGFGVERQDLALKDIMPKIICTFVKVVKRYI